MCTRKAFPCSVGLLLCFLQICVANNHETCSPSSCGKITNISHPFRLKDDPATCGDPRYQLACENNMTVLNLFSARYYVKAINYNNYTIRLVDPAIQYNDCSSVPRYFLSSSYFSYRSFSYWGRYLSTNYTYADIQLFQPVIYLKCGNPVKDDPRYVDTALCVNWHSKGHFYAIVGDLSPGDLKVDCHVKLVAATSVFFNFTRYYYGEIVPDNENYSYAEIHSMLVYGFDVSWMSRACEDSCDPNQYCLFNETSGNIGCYLADSCSSNEILSKLCIFVEAFVLGIIKGLLHIRGVNLFNEVGFESESTIEMERVIRRSVLLYIIVRFLLGLIVFFALLAYTCRRRHSSMYENIEDFLRGNTLMPIRYSYKEIKKMSRGFKDKLGEGGYGCVYKGRLSSGPFAAIKMLVKPKTNGQEFINEVATIGRIHHANVVRLIGFCAEGSKRALVYEFMPNGSLDTYIFSKKDSISLTYDQMYKISLEVAHGIAYLHQGCDMQILHFDIKPHNILLDENFIPKVSDFGLAKLYPIDNNIVTVTAARGTIGYMAPELFYQNIGGVSYKADVYSFGMLLMEIASRRRNLNPVADHSSQLYFPFWIYNQLTEVREIEMKEVTDEEKNNLKKMFLVALWCIQLKPSDRPSMNKVIEMLEGDVENIEIPPKPSLYPNEMIQGDLKVNSDQTLSDDSTSSTSFLEETTINPLLKYST